MQGQETMMNIEEVIKAGAAADMQVREIIAGFENDSPVKKASGEEISTGEFLDLANAAYVAKKASAVAVLMGIPDEVEEVAEVVADIPVAQIAEALTQA